MAEKIGVALYGLNGHQVQGMLVAHPRARLVAVAEFDRARLPEPLQKEDSIRFCTDLAEIVALREVDLVVLCSPRRADQARDAVFCLENGKHVYAEKPAAFSEPELDEILTAAHRNDRKFHEMAGSALEQPFLALREKCLAGEIGEVIQVFAQKSYPFFESRPQDENLDGGLLMQVGIHAVRFIEQISGQRVTGVTALDTQTGNPLPGGLRMACAANMRLANGGIATMIANYCNSRKFGTWGNEEVRVFGTKGFLEATNGGTKTHFYLNEEDRGAIEYSGTGYNFFDLVLGDILGEGGLPLSLEEELRPLRVVIQARAAAMSSRI